MRSWLAGTRRPVTRSPATIFLVPAIILTAVWVAYPLLRVVLLSLTDYEALIPGASVTFVGLDNIVNALADVQVREGLIRSIVFTMMFLPGAIILPLGAAIAIDRLRQRRAKAIYRFLLLIPVFIPGPMIFLLWRWMYMPAIGPIDHILIDIAGVFDYRSVPNWTGQSELIFPAIIAMEWWWGIGYHTLFFLAGLATIPKDVLAQARVDGASELRVIWHVILPLLRPIFAILIVLRIGSAMAVIDEFLIYGGLQANLPTYSWTVYMYDTAFRLGNWAQGYASAISLIGTFVVLVGIALMFRLTRASERY